MSMHMCDRKEQLIGFLYGELDPSEARVFEQHLFTCAECRVELEDLRATRGQIAAWTPPEPHLDFQIVRGPVPARPAPPRFRVAPAWGLAAAASLVMAIGAAIANLDVRVGRDGLVVRTGWNRTAAIDTPAGADTGEVRTVDWTQQAQQLDQRLREIEQALARNRAESVQRAGAPAMTDEELLQRVRDMLGQSETRQQRVLAARLAQITHDFDAQRRIDIAAVDQGMARLQNTSGAEVRQYRDLIQRMYRATAYQQAK
jgi:hypothetical protein